MTQEPRQPKEQILNTQENQPKLTVDLTGASGHGEKLIIYQKPKPIGIAIAGMVLGIVSSALLFVSCFTLFFVSFPIAIVGTVLSASGRKKQKTDVATAGLVLSILALCCSVVAGGLFLFVFTMAFL